MFKSNLFNILIIALMLVPCMASGEFTYQGEARLETRQFKQDDLDRTKDNALAAYLRAELKYTGETFASSFRGYGLLDTIDDDRNTLTVEDLYTTVFFNEDETLSLTAGYKIFNWSATEAFHPADVLNSRNLDSNLESLDKIGELHIEGYMETDIGGFSLFYMPYSMDPKYPGRRSRLGAGVELKEPVWVEGNNDWDTGNWHHQFALRYVKTFDNIDFTSHIIHHMNRLNPIIKQTTVYENILGFNVPVDLEFTPYFFKALQIGGTYQHAIDGGWLLKSEWAWRNFYDNGVKLETNRGERSPRDHGILAAGVEYVMSHEGGYESNLVLEGQTVLGQGKEARSELSIFQRDLMLGWRLAFNDTMGKELFLSIIRDIERKNETLYNFYYTQRITEYWKLKTGFRVYDAPQKGELQTGLESYHNAHYVFLNLSRFF